jgi:hypothetical protein
VAPYVVLVRDIVGVSLELGAGAKSRVQFGFGSNQ